jgi:uncharacterized membrane protein YoaK (UPF0700 family)
MSSANSADPGINPDDGDLVNANAAVVLKHPFAMVLLLAMVAGAMDARDYQSFEVFTANQAGNMVLLWVKLLSEPGVALLSLGSLIGAALGITFVVYLRSWRHWFSGAAGSRSLLYLAAFVLAITSVLGDQLFSSVDGKQVQDLVVWTQAWTAAVASVMLSAFALGTLATVFVSAGSHKAGVIASTGPFVDGTRYLAASVIYRDPQFRAKWKYLLAFPAAWSLGAVIVGLSPLNRASITLLGVALVVAVAFFAKRVQS